eukprot:GEMP01064264.1.p1 GENE.GEMP01064264.1~~GEMP01064264.1.p1  ORF type:complete len:101 (-),score=7.98 GEMP01064264.1:658-960(-)
MISVAAYHGESMQKKENISAAKAERHHIGLPPQHFQLPFCRAAIFFPWFRRRAIMDNSRFHGVPIPRVLAREPIHCSERVVAKREAMLGAPRVPVRVECV